MGMARILAMLPAALSKTSVHSCDHLLANRLSAHAFFSPRVMQPPAPSSTYLSQCLALASRANVKGEGRREMSHEQHPVLAYNFAQCYRDTNNKGPEWLPNEDNEFRKHIAAYLGWEFTVSAKQQRVQFQGRFGAYYYFTCISPTVFELYKLEFQVRLRASACPRCCPSTHICPLFLVHPPATRVRTICGMYGFSHVVCKARASAPWPLALRRSVTATFDVFAVIHPYLKSHLTGIHGREGFKRRQEGQVWSVLPAANHPKNPTSQDRHPDPGAGVRQGHVCLRAFCPPCLRAVRAKTLVLHPLFSRLDEPP